VGAPGCFYTEVINVAPEANISRVDPTVPFEIGKPLRLTAAASRDDGAGTLFYEWEARTCATCAAFTYDTQQVFEIVHGDHDEVIVSLRVIDEHGAVGRAFLQIEPVNQLAAVDVVPQGVENPDGTFLAHTPILFKAVANDPDGDEVSFSFRVFPPPQTRQEYEFDKDDDKTYRLLPDVGGMWQVEVTADDGYGGMTTVRETVIVADDQPPCIAATTPLWSPDARIILPRAGGPRAFAVESVTDDLDAWPGTEELHFRWLTGLVGQPLGEVSGHDVSELLVDPADLDPGDVIAVRVEISDREPRVLPCSSDQAACSLTSNECFQRLTWTAEVR
jgi:hypothetical protein